MILSYFLTPYFERLMALPKNGLHILLKRNYSDSVHTNDTEGYMEVTITNIILPESPEKHPLIKFMVHSTFGQHKTNEVEWHDELWCGRWCYECTLPDHKTAIIND